jgi:hypothetical protein
MRHFVCVVSAFGIRLQEQLHGPEMGERRFLVAVGYMISGARQGPSRSITLVTETSPMVSGFMMRPLPAMVP